VRRTEQDGNFVFSRGLQCVHNGRAPDAPLYTVRSALPMLSRGGRIVAFGLADEILALWLDTAFAGGRHQRRIDQISEAERQS
jgi:ribose 5-phosphate isomerase B